jgi:hypothetical protein
MKVATKSFAFTDEDGHRDEVVADVTRVYEDDHPLVTGHPDCWRTVTGPEKKAFYRADVEDECAFRKERLAARPSAGRKPQSAAGRRQAADDDFWGRMVSELAPPEPPADENLAVIEEYDAAQARAANDGISEMWHGRLEAGWHARTAG